MINIKEIESFYPESLKPFKKNILREYLQYKILEIIFDSEFGKYLIFMGGTAIRIVHSNERFSEDLDFDNQGLGKKEFQRMVAVIKKKLEREGYVLEVREIFNNVYRVYLKIINVLFDSGISGHKKEKLLIQIDTEPQQFNYVPKEFILNKFDVFSQIKIVPVDILLAQKIYCIFNRKRPMGRDFYDLVFLSGKTAPNFDYLKDKMNIEDKKDLKIKILKLCEKLNFKQLAEDTASFLFNSGHKKRVLLFKEYIENCEF